jgi:hypothetical protein
MINKNGSSRSVQPTQSEVGVRAYQLWERAGKPAGKDLDFWLKAEEQLSGARHEDLIVVPVLRKK